MKQNPRSKPVDSAIVWSGRSQLDPRAPIVAIVTGLRKRSHNPKTGPMAQLWILRADIPPCDAVAQGTDRAICGTCPYASGHGCYVAVRNAPTAVYRKFLRGGYARRLPRTIARQLATDGRKIRLGAYGDPAALPIAVIQTLTSGVPGWTGYTHSWRIRPDLAPYVMASADSERDRFDAMALGFRSFRVKAPEQLPTLGEIVCPASDEAGKRTTCDRCNLCNGADGLDDARKSIVINAHGFATVHALKILRFDGSAVQPTTVNSPLTC